MKITGIKKVQGMTTFFDYDEFPRSLLDTFNLLKQNEDRDLENAVINQFSKFAGSYIKSITSKIEGIGEEKLRIHYGNEAIIFESKGKKIIPGREFLDGYIPILEFKILKNEITAVSYFKREGTSELKILEDILKNYKQNGDVLEKPKIKFKEEKENYRELIYVASTNLIPKVLNSLEKIYKYIGETRFGDLWDIYNGITSLGSEILYSKNGTAKNILKDEYERRIRDFYPANLFD